MSPPLTEENETKIAVPAVALSYYFPEGWRKLLSEEARATLVWEPIAVPWLFPESDERWFPPAAQTQPELLIPELDGVQIGGVPFDPCPCAVAIEQTLRNSPPPARRFDNGNLGLRFSGRTSGVDWALSYFDGFDPAASFTVPVRLQLSDRPETPGIFEATALTELRPAYLRYRSIGVDAATARGAATIRVEGAWKFSRPYPRDVRSLPSVLLDDPSLVEELIEGRTVTLDAFARRDALEWGVGVDYFVAGFLPLVELYQIVLVHNDTPLLIEDVDTRLLVTVRKSWFADRLESEALFLWGIESDYQLARAELTYHWSDEIAVVGGVLGVWGNAFSLIGEFNDNSEAYARIRFRF
jgi:hypothetical protein